MIISILIRINFHCHQRINVIKSFWRNTMPTRSQREQLQLLQLLETMFPVIWPYGRRYRNTPFLTISHKSLFSTWLSWIKFQTFFESNPWFFSRNLIRTSRPYKHHFTFRSHLGPLSLVVVLRILGPEWKIIMKA